METQKDTTIFEKPIRTSNDFKKLAPRLIFLILGVVILAELVLVFKAFRETPPPFNVVQPKPVTGGQIVLVAEKKVVKVGDDVKLQIRIDTGGRITNGTDLILKYDTNFFEATSSGLVTGKIYPEYPLKEVSQKDGSVRISGISSSSKTFNGVGVLATLDLKAKKSGNSSIVIDYKKGSTTDSNIITVKDAQDILENVGNTSITIQ